MPELGRIAMVGVEDFANIPSEQMQPHNWLQLAQRVRTLTQPTSPRAGP
ncbi:MAG: asparaginase [Anaerolineae bacterium]|nr:MAG: asparaginase [Anaerolineae bacterium]